MVWPPPTIEAPPSDADGVAGGTAIVPALAPAASAPVTQEVRAAPTPATAEAPAPAPVEQPLEWQRNPQVLLGATLGQRYAIHTLIGRGPMGIVVEGRVPESGRSVAIKLLPLPPQHSPERFVWLVREAAALAHFDHPNVEPVYDFGSLPDGSMYLVRNQTSGLPLRLLLRQGRLPGLRALMIARQIAVALDSAHTRDIMHGRLKPENVIVITAPDGTDQVRLIDFGMSALGGVLPGVSATSEDARHLALRSRLYWPAEYDGTAAPGAYVDLYSLGVLMFEMIAGQPPFLFDTAELGSMPPRPPPTFAQCTPPIHVPKAVEELVQALLGPDLAQHCPAPDEVIAALDTLLAGRVSPAGARTSAPPPAPAAAPAPPPAAPSPPAAAAAPPAAAAAVPPPLAPALQTVAEAELAPLPVADDEPERADQTALALPELDATVALGSERLTPVPDYLASLPPPPEPLAAPAPAPAAVERKASRPPPPLPAQQPTISAPPTSAPSGALSRPPPPPSRRRRDLDSRPSAPPSVRAAPPLPPPQSQVSLPALQQPAPPTPPPAPYPGQPNFQPPNPAQPQSPRSASASSYPPGFPQHPPAPGSRPMPPPPPWLSPPPGAPTHHAAPPPYPGAAPPQRSSAPPPYPPPGAAPPTRPSEAPADDEDDADFRSGGGGTWSKLKNLVGRKKPEGF